MCLIYQVKRGTAGINLDDLLLWINFIETSTNWLITSQLPRAIKKCPRCKENDAVYFQSQQRAADTGMVRLHCCVWDYASDISQNCTTSVHRTIMSIPSFEHGIGGFGGQFSFASCWSMKMVQRLASGVL
jgi:hypothetical protein